jgi:uncharacterized membrane protein YGL010W
MKTIVKYLSQYAFYHQTPKNVVTHFIGIPMILVAIAVLLSRPHFSILSIEFAPAFIAAVVCGLFYLHLDKAVGLLMVFLLGLSLWFANFMAAQTTWVWLTVGVGLFVVGWIIQFIGHHFEGKKPAFFDDIMGLVIGPLFVVVEVLFLMGLKKDWKQKIHDFCKQKNQMDD